MSVLYWSVASLILLYLIFVFWYSLRMLKAFNINYWFLILIGFLFPPIWIILAIVAFGINSYKGNQKKK